MVTSTAPELPRIRLAAGAVTRSVPSLYSAVVWPASFTSRPLSGSAGRMSTVVSARSAATSWMRPAGMARMAVIGAVVANVGIVLSCALEGTELVMRSPSRPVQTRHRHAADTTTHMATDMGIDTASPPRRLDL